MDNTQLNPAAAPQTPPPVAPAVPAAPNVIPPVMPTPPSETRSSSKLIMFLIIGVVFIALLVGGVYLYLNNKQSADLKNNQTGLYTAPVATPVAQENLDSDLSAINVATDDSDFASVDKDLQGL